MREGSTIFLRKIFRVTRSILAEGRGLRREYL